MRERAMLYLRQSTTREESISLELQETACRAYCESRGYDVVGVEADPGISGRVWNRPAFQRTLASIEDHSADVIICWKWSRISRARYDWALAAKGVEDAGGRIESATEPLDMTNATGRFAQGMMTNMAAFESERIGDGWRESHARRISQGLPANGKPRFGYIYERATGFTIDPVTGPVLSDAFTRYVSGESIYALVKWLNDGPTRPVGGYGPSGDGLWSARTLRRVMDSGFSAGLISSKGETMPGVHDAIVDADQWEAYQEARQRRRVYRRVERSQYLLSGLVRCHCGSSMTAGQFGANRTPKYRCKAASEKRAHTGGYVMASLLEAEVFAWLTAREARLNAEILSVSKEARPAKTRTRVVDIDGKLSAVAAKLETLADRLVDPGIPHATYVRLRDKYVAEQRALEESRLTVSVQAKVAPVRIVPELLANWHLGKVEEKREILRALIDHVEVYPGRPRARVVIHERE